MKKSINKLILSILLAFIAIINVNADGVCQNVKIKGGLDMTTCASWKVPVYTCTKKSYSYTCGYFDYGTADEAKESCKYEGWQYYDAEKYSGQVYVSYPDCDESIIAIQTTCNISYSYNNWECTTAINEREDGEIEEEEVCDWVPRNFSTQVVSSTCSTSFLDSALKIETPKEEIEQTFYDTLHEIYVHNTVNVIRTSDVHVDCTVKYGLNKASAHCSEVGPTIINPCEFDFKTPGGEDAYCVNPSNKPTNLSNEISVDPTICESSNSTIDCGFSNILIEGNYRGYSSTVIKLAMHMWGGHAGLAGYKNVGIIPFTNTQGNNFSQWVDLPLLISPVQKKYLNIFKESSVFHNVTLHFMSSIDRSHNFNSIYDLNIEDNYSGLKAAVCNTIDPGGMGVVCGTNGNETDYLKAYYLYASTIIGNPKMLYHLAILNGYKGEEKSFVEFSNEPVSVSTEIKDDNKVIVSYQLKEGVEIDCNTAKGIDTDKCVTSQEISIYNASGELLNAKIDAYDYCKKNFCFKTVTTKSKITCDILNKEETHIKVITNSKKACGSNNVKKYVPCTNPDEYQIMYSFKKDNCINNDKNLKPEEKIIDQIITCESCKEVASYNDPSCSTSDITKHNASDPSLNCILHKSSFSENTTNNKLYYDYSDYFNVNTNICKVYCSDEVEYYLPGKKTVLLGLQLKYDIENQAFKNRTKNNANKLTSAVMVRRNCVSNIFYDDNKFDYNKNWTKAYDLPENINITNWNEFYAAVETNSSNQNNRTEVLNELIYDLYNCNFFTDKEITSIANTVKKPKNSINSMDVAKKNLKIESENIIKNTSSTIKYEGGAEYIKAVDGSSNNSVGTNGNDPVLMNNTSRGISPITVKYCDKGNCFNGMKSDGTYSEDYDKAKTESNFDSVKLAGNSVTIPSNDYAIFSLETEVDFYNSSEYEVQPYSGNVQIHNNNDKKTNQSEYLVLEKYTYPVSLAARTKCKNGKCSVKHKFNIQLFSRKNDSDLLTSAINKASEYSCLYTVDSDKNLDDGKMSYGFAYKNIDLKNPFPSSRTQTGSNWGTEHAEKVIGRIVESGNNNLYATDDYLEYSYVLNAEAINSLRTYNMTNSYTNNTLMDCKSNDNKYFDCKSSLLSDINLGMYGGSQIKTDGISAYTQNRNSGGVN